MTSRTDQRKLDEVRARLADLHSQHDRATQSTDNGGSYRSKKDAIGLAQVAHDQALRMQARGVDGADQQVAQTRGDYDAAVRGFADYEQRLQTASKAVQDVLGEFASTYHEHHDLLSAEAEQAARDAESALRELEVHIAQAQAKWANAVLLWQPLCEVHGLERPGRFPVQIAPAQPRPSGRPSNPHADGTGPFRVNLPQAA